MRNHSLEYVICDVCGFHGSAFFMHQRDRVTGELFTLVKCEQCGHIYLNPRPGQDEISKYYPATYECFVSEEFKHSNAEAWHLLRSNKWKLDYIVRNTLNTGRLLDIGCGTGDFLKLCKDSKWEVTGIELMEKAAEIAREKHDLTVLTGTFENIELPTNYYDVITLWDVLEHLPSPRQTFIRIHQLLKKNRGWVVFSIPNLSSFDRRLFDHSWIGWDAPRHFHSFSEKNIHMLVESTGYQIIRKDCITGAKGAFWLSVCMINPRLRNSLMPFEPLISLALWPYRQISYLLRKGPIITYLVRKV